jgi:hypothetical protein|tara:strand:- start:5382 stop:6092 length:711 start_codon:yes stop_codon:yes gene_type:complete
MTALNRRVAKQVNDWHLAYSPTTNYPKCSIDWCILPEKYNVDIDVLSNEIDTVLETVPMKQYTFPNGKAFPGYYGLCFKSRKGSTDPLYEGLSSNVLSQLGQEDTTIDPDFTEKNDIWFTYLDEIENKFQGQVTQVRLIKLEAGHNLGYGIPHTDYPWYDGIRMHIPLTPNLKYQWNVMDNIYFAERGSGVVYLDTSKPHTAINEANLVDRYVLNINMIPLSTSVPLHDQINNGIL